MHPLLLNGRRMLAIAMLWLALSFLLAFVLSEYTATRLVEAVLFFTPWYFVLLLFCLPNFYICSHLPLDRTHTLPLAGTQAASTVASVLTWLGLGYLWARHGPGIGGNSLNVYQASLYFNAALGVGLYFIWIIIHYTWLTARGDEEENSEALRQKLLISQIELQVVRATLHPHFLYNSLSMLANLSLSAPEKIHPLCVQMSDFLRYSVSYSRKDQVTVDEELAHVQNYLNIEKERFGDKLKVEYRVDDGVRSETMLPLILFPLVENCIKHGIDSSVDGGFIAVEVRRQENRLHFEISNSFDPLGTAARSTGLGQQSLRRYILSRYGEAATMTLERGENRYKVSLSLPLSNTRLIENRE